MKKTLNPLLFNNQNLIYGKVRKKLLQIVDEFVETLKIKIKIKDIIVVGSIVGYNYHSKSDIDLHIIVDYNDINIDGKSSKEILDELFFSKKRLWDEKRKIFIKGIPVELYIQPADKDDNTFNGIYSLKKNNWISFPSKENNKIDKSKFKDIKDKCNYFINKINANKDNLNVLIKIKEDILNLRKIGLGKNRDEFGVENLSYKKLRSKNVLKRLDKRIRFLKDAQLSLEENI